MKSLSILLAAIAAVGVGTPLVLAQGSVQKSAKPGVKYADVQKILTVNCVRCHGDARPRGGINLTNYDAIMKGGEDGPVVVAKDLKKSVLYQAVMQAPQYRPMPPRGPKLSDADLKTIETWIKNGAKK